MCKAELMHLAFYCFRVFSNWGVGHHDRLCHSKVTRSTINGLYLVPQPSAIQDKRKISVNHGFRYVPDRWSNNWDQLTIFLIYKITFMLMPWPTCQRQSDRPQKIVCHVWSCWSRWKESGMLRALAPRNSRIVLGRPVGPQNAHTILIKMPIWIYW